MTLTQAATLVKRSIIISVVALVLGIIGFIGYQIWHAYYLANLPPVEEKPDTKFGLLPAIDFPQSSVSSSNFSYSLDTVTGGLPKIGIDPGFEKNIKVYFLTQTFATLLSPDRSQSLAEKFGFNSPPEILSETKYRFKDKDKSLLVDLDTGNFSYTKEATVSGNITPDDNSKLIADFKQMLSSFGVLKNDLQNGRDKITASKTTILVSLWPGTIDKKPVFTADFNKSLVNATLIGRANQLDNYLSLNFTYYPIDTSTFATYPLKSPEQAFDDLKNGKGVVVVVSDKPQVSITSVSLGYYLPEKYNPYLQPIYVFEGANFVAYVSAISEQFQSVTH